jgi:CheY-like chemotaxis protein
MSEGSLPTVTALVANLFFSLPIADAIRAAGAEPEIIDDVADLWPAIERWPALVLLDLAVPGDWQTAVRRAKTLPQTRSIPIVAFGSHVDTDTLRVARQAGCDHAWARSRFMTSLPQLLSQTLCPPPRWPAGWDQAPPAQLCAGIAQFNAGEYWECHETLEGLWIAEPRPVRDLYQGILQIGVAFHHLRCHSHAGALKMLRR